MQKLSDLIILSLAGDSQRLSSKAQVIQDEMVFAQRSSETVMQYTLHPTDTEEKDKRNSNETGGKTGC